MTWFLAVSLSLLTSFSTRQQLAGPDSAWAKVKTKIVKIQGNGQVTGMGVLIDSKGLFLAHRSALSGPAVLGLIDDAGPYQFVVLATDSETQLALLESSNWKPDGRPGISVAAEPKEGSKLIAATPFGPVRGEFVTGNNFGQLRPSLRYAPLSEVRIESNIGKIAGALVFDESGSLVGLLGATLTGDKGASNRVAKSVSPMKADDLLQLPNKSYGPQGLTVAYSLGVPVIQRVVSGFLSPTHEVQHPSIGLFFKDSSFPGALVEVVKKGSPADISGILPGDLVVDVNGKAITTMQDLAVFLFRQAVGDVLKIKLIRGEQELNLEVKVGTLPRQF